MVYELNHCRILETRNIDKYAQLCMRSIKSWKKKKKKKKKKRTGKKRLEPQLKLETKFNTSGNDLPTWPYYPTSYGMNQYYTLVYICNWMAFASLSWFANNPCLYCIDIWIHLVLWLGLTVILVAQQSISMNERHWAEQQIPFFFSGNIISGLFIHQSKPAGKSIPSLCPLPF